MAIRFYALCAEAAWNCLLARSGLSAEFLKAHRKMEEQEATIAKQQEQIEALTTGLQKVSDEVELSKPAPRTVLNNQ